MTETNGYALLKGESGDLWLAILEPINKGWLVILRGLYFVVQQDRQSIYISTYPTHSLANCRYCLPLSLLPIAILAELLWHFKPDSYTPNHGGSPTPHHGGNV